MRSQYIIKTNSNIIHLNLSTFLSFAHGTNDCVVLHPLNYDAYTPCIVPSLQLLCNVRFSVEYSFSG